MSCLKYLPSSLVTYIQQQMENDDLNKVFFDDCKEHEIDKLIMNSDHNHFIH